MHKMFYIVSTSFDAIISPYSGSWHQSFFKIYSNEIVYNQHAVSVVQNITGFGQKGASKYNFMLVKQDFFFNF
jgi:hypothetical protein